MALFEWKERHPRTIYLLEEHRYPGGKSQNGISGWQRVHPMKYTADYVEAKAWVEDIKDIHVSRVCIKVNLLEETGNE